MMEAFTIALALLIFIIATPRLSIWVSRSIIKGYKSSARLLSVRTCIPVAMLWFLRTTTPVVLLHRKRFKLFPNFLYDPLEPSSRAKLLT